MIGVGTTSSAITVNLPTGTSREVGRMYFIFYTAPVMLLQTT